MSTHGSLTNITAALSDTDCPLWFDVRVNGSECTSLNWTTPLGVLFDLHGPLVREGVPASMPWKITVHFMYYPSPQSIPEFKVSSNGVL